MRCPTLAIAAVTVAALGVAACSSPAPDAPAASDSAITGDVGASAQGACSLTYWRWALETLKPQLQRSIADVPEQDLMALVAGHPPIQETATTYAVCWSPLFDQFFFADAARALHQAEATFVDASSPDHLSYPQYLANIAMTPELRRNAKALLALRPATMEPSDVGPWMKAYDTIIAESIRPVGVPGLHEYDGIVEPEWVISAPEAEYLAVVEQAHAAPSADGVYGEWVTGFGTWVLGPPPAESRSFVFNVPWEAAAERDAYGLAGLALVNGAPVVPAQVDAFLTRLKATMPRSTGARDTSAWWAIYNARALRALGDLSQQQPVLSKTDAMALDVLESVKPLQPRGPFAYGTWLDLAVIAATQNDASWSQRFLPLEPCLDAADRAAADQAYQQKAARSSIPAPHVCAP